MLGYMRHPPFPTKHKALSKKWYPYPDARETSTFRCLEVPLRGVGCRPGPPRARLVLLCVGSTTEHRGLPLGWFQPLLIVLVVIPGNLLSSGMALDVLGAAEPPRSEQAG